MFSPWISFELGLRSCFWSVIFPYGCEWYKRMYAVWYIFNRMLSIPGTQHHMWENLSAGHTESWDNWDDWNDMMIIRYFVGELISVCLIIFDGEILNGNDTIRVAGMLLNWKCVMESCALNMPLMNYLQKTYGLDIYLSTIGIQSQVQDHCGINRSNTGTQSKGTSAIANTKSLRGTRRQFTSKEKFPQSHQNQSCLSLNHIHLKYRLNIQDANLQRKQ